MCELECPFGSCYYGQPIRQQLAYLDNPSNLVDHNWLANFRDFLLKTEAAMEASGCDHLLAKAAVRQAWIRYSKALRQQS